MRTVGAYEAKTHLAELLDEVEEGGTITIARHGRPVALLVPASAPRHEVDSLVAAIRAFADRHTLGDMGIREMIEEGRR